MTRVQTLRRSPLETAHALAPRIHARAAEIEAQRELPPDLVAELIDAGFFRLLVPRSLGGAELDLPTYVEVIEVLAHADGSTAWCVNQGAVFATNAAYVREEVARRIWGDPRTVVANGPAPSATATVVPGGYRVSGRWTFSSGCCHANWLAGFAVILDGDTPRRRPDGTPEARYMLFPKEAAEIIDTWQVRGLRGTGSHHFAVRDLFVPSACTVWSYSDPPREPGPLYVYPMVLLFASGFAAVALGVARCALDAFVALANEKKPRGDEQPLREQPLVQAQMGQAEATWRAARAFLYETVRDVWEAVCRTRTITLEQRVRLRLATTHAIRQAAQAVDLVYHASGATAIYISHPIQRCFQDIHVITQHVQARLAHYEAVGRFFLGLEPPQQWL
ncbi:MAG: acyl-CoA dehydrogenase [Candidatus Tectimicrobiota bacterium]|nr:MAG: acyl-CoA dehydrogenase [Candidatus Tectomicrobia bacterium]